MYLSTYHLARLSLLGQNNQSSHLIKCDFLQSYIIKLICKFVPFQGEIINYFTVITWKDLMEIQDEGLEDEIRPLQTIEVHQEC